MDQRPHNRALPPTKYITIEGNEAAARIAYKLSEVIAIYPITPASPMGEWADQWAAADTPNLWGEVPHVAQLQSEAGAAGAVHGALQAGAMATTFTASQGLLLMIPNMYKIAGELTPTVFHIAARTVASHALSIFGDHSDVMAARATGWGMLFAASVQETMDMALIAHASTLATRIPFLHVFDGFRTSHEVMKIESVSDEHIRAMIDERLVQAHRARALTPDRPVIRGTAQNPDVFFQSREGANPYYLATPTAVQEAMDRFATLTGRRYRLFDYVGHPAAERVLVLMGSACGAATETVNELILRGERVGLVKVRLFRPFSVEDFITALPPTVKAMAVLDRTKEPGSAGEPLYQDVLTAVQEAVKNGQAPFDRPPLVVGGRYGLGQKEFTPAMARAVLDELARERPQNRFTIGIHDDVTHTSLPWDPRFITEPPNRVQAIFWGLGSDGTVSANKNTIKIIGEQTEHHVQGHFVYDSKKAGAVTISHLRFGPDPIESTYEIQRADFIGVHQFQLLERFDTLQRAAKGATLLINSPYGKATWDHLPPNVQETIRNRHLTVYAIDAYAVASEVGLGSRINTIMQTCFLALSAVLPQDEAIAKIKEAINHTYGKRGKAVVEANHAAVDAALAHLYEVQIPPREQLEPIVTAATGSRALSAANNGANGAHPIMQSAPSFVKEVTSEIMAGRGDELPVSALPCDGTYPVGTARYEKRNIAQEIPVWDPDLCIQCGKCVIVCPHAVIRSKVYDPKLLQEAPATFKSAPARWREMRDQRYTLQVANEDCTGCALCVEVCPVQDKQQPDYKAINMSPHDSDLRLAERENWSFFSDLPELNRMSPLSFHQVKNVQLLEPLFEFSGACAGCGETPYLKLLSQLYGDRALIANATGCSSIYGGNLPTTPWASNRDGRGPAWSNSLFEDNAEFGLGMRLALDRQVIRARNLLLRLANRLPSQIVSELSEELPDPGDEQAIASRRQHVSALKERLRQLEGTWPSPSEEVWARDLLELADALVPKSVWLVGGDGWAYDIGYGGLDHVLASPYDVNILILDTEVYSNTGGQASKATPKWAVARFATRGKRQGKKDLAWIAAQYGHVYVATVAMGASDTQTLQAFREAASFPGPSLIIAYSQCIAHGIDMRKGMHHQRLAVSSGHWPLFRYDPRRPEHPLQLDSKEPTTPLRDYLYEEVRYRLLERSDPETAQKLLEEAQKDVQERWQRLAVWAAAGQKV